MDSTQQDSENTTYNLMLDATATGGVAKKRFARPSINFSNLFSKINDKARFPIIILVSTLVIIAGAIYLLSQTNFLNNSSQANIAGEKAEIASAKAQMELNREFSFPLKDSKGVEVSRLKFVLENVELRDEIIVKGQRATAVKGRTFLIINEKIANEYSSAVEINSRDYIRLQVNGSSEWLAPEIHNDPVEVQAISTKYTRLGFPINESDQSLKLQVGEINGEKQIIDLSF